MPLSSSYMSATDGRSAGSLGLRVVLRSGCPLMAGTGPLCSACPPDAYAAGRPFACESSVVQSHQGRIAS